MADLRTLKQDEILHAERLDELYSDYHEEFIDRHEIESLITGLNDHVVVAEEDDKIVGASSYFLDNHKAELSNFIVDSDYRGRGIGNQLVEYCIEEIKSYEPSLYFACCTTEHLGSQKIFSEHGMTPLALWRNSSPISFENHRASLLLLGGFNKTGVIRPSSVPDHNDELAENVLKTTGFRDYRVTGKERYKGSFRWTQFDIRDDKSIFQVFSDQHCYARNSGTPEEFFHELDTVLDQKDNEYVRVEIDSALGLPETITQALPDFTSSGFSPQWLWTGNRHGDALMLEKYEETSSKIKLLPEFAEFLDWTGHSYKIVEEENNGLKAKLG